MSVWFLGIMVGLALVGEVFEAWIGFGYAKKYGGSSRAGWGALVGGVLQVAVLLPAT